MIDCFEIAMHETGRIPVKDFCHQPVFSGQGNRGYGPGIRIDAHRHPVTVDPVGGVIFNSGDYRVKQRLKCE